MNVVKEIDRINELELKNGIYGGLTKGSWHDQYSESAWVYIGGLSYELSEGDIICVMSQWGEIEDINLVREKGTNKSQGFCFLKYEDQRSTILAVDNFNGVKLLGRVVRCDHVEKYKLPKEVRDKETEMLENDPSAQISIGPGHAYKDVELENDYNINSGIDLWNQAPEAAVEEVRASREEPKQKKEKKEKKDKKEKKVKKVHKHENKDKEINSVDDNSRDKEKGERDRRSDDRRGDTSSREHHHRREDSRADSRGDRGRNRSRDRSSRDSRDSRDRNRDRSRDRRGSERDGGRDGRDRGVDRREHNRRGERESGQEDRSQRSSDNKRHRDDRDEGDRREDRRDNRRIDNNSSSSSSGVPAATLPISSVPMPKLGGAATGFSMEAQGPVASWRGSRDPVVQSQATIYGNKNFGPKKTFVSELGPDGKPVVDNSNKRGEFAGFGGMNRLR